MQDKTYLEKNKDFYENLDAEKPTLFIALKISEVSNESPNITASPDSK